MLFQLLDNVCKKINNINATAEVPKFAEQWLKMRPNLKAELKAQGIAEDKIESAILALSLSQLGVIKAIPSIVSEMTNILNSRSGEPAFRTVVAASLAYLVQPQDLLPDNLPGYYGFVDDVLLLQESCALSWEITGNITNAEERRKIFQFIFMFVPDGQREEFQNAISGLATTLNLMRYLDPMTAEMTIQMLIANPLQPIAPQAGVGGTGGPSQFGRKFTDYSSISRPQYSWRDGDTIGVSFPGGGGVAADSSGVYIL